MGGGKTDRDNGKQQNGKALSKGCGRIRDTTQIDMVTNWIQVVTIPSFPVWKARQMGPLLQTSSTVRGASLQGKMKVVVPAGYPAVCATGYWKQRFGSHERG